MGEAHLVGAGDILDIGQHQNLKIWINSNGPARKNSQQNAGLGSAELDVPEKDTQRSPPRKLDMIRTEVKSPAYK